MKRKIKIAVLAMVPIVALINLIFGNCPEFVEKYYSESTDKLIREALSIITGVFPFSVGEILVISLFLILFMQVILVIINIKKKDYLHRLLNIGVVLSSLYIFCMLLWGFNYQRPSFDKLAGLSMGKATKTQLYSLCLDLIKKTNTQREGVSVDANGVAKTEGGASSVLKRAGKGYKVALMNYPFLDGYYGNPKPFLLSYFLSYTGITGIYIPYTGEANVNTNVDSITLPFTACHEMAHQRGFAREDEANYIAYITCTANNDMDFKYSGNFMASIYAMNALAEVDPKGFNLLNKQYSDKVKKDLLYHNEFWKKYEGIVQKTSNNINNTYLKSNGQQDGTESYGRVVDLLLAQYEKSGLD